MFKCSYIHYWCTSQSRRWLKCSSNKKLHFRKLLVVCSTDCINMLNSWERWCTVFSYHLLRISLLLLHYQEVISCLHGKMIPLHFSLPVVHCPLILPYTAPNSMVCMNKPLNTFQPQTFRWEVENVFHSCTVWRTEDGWSFLHIPLLCI
jgi:hypothetical protein